MATKTIKLNGGSDDIKISKDNIPDIYNTEILWVNSNPTNAFASQRITFSKNVKGVIITYREYSSNARGFSTTIFYRGEQTEGALTGIRYSSSPYYYYTRTFILSANSINFDTAYPMTSYGTWGSADNNYAVPTVITGIIY